MNVQVTDNVSGVVSFSGRLVPNFENGGNAIIYFYGYVGSPSTQDLGNNIYSVECEVGKFFPAGEYRLESFEANDRANFFGSVGFSAPSSNDTYAIYGTYLGCLSRADKICSTANFGNVKGALTVGSPNDCEE